MSRVMYDSTAAADIPATAPMVGGYLPPSRFVWSDADWARFPHAVKVRIAVRATVNAGHVLDVERGDATPAEAPGWVEMRRAAGADPTVYCSAAAWPDVKAAFTAAQVAQPHYWIAAYPGGGAVIPAGAVAHQWANEDITGHHYDESVVADFWPGVDEEELVTTPTTVNTRTLQRTNPAYGSDVLTGDVDLEGMVERFDNSMRQILDGLDANASSIAALKAELDAIKAAVGTPGTAEGTVAVTGGTITFAAATAVAAGTPVVGPKQPTAAAQVTADRTPVTASPNPPAAPAAG